MQPIIKESELHKAISSQCPAAIFTPSDYYKNCDILIETMELVVSENAASEFEKEIYRKKLTIDETNFLNLINNHNNDDKRQQRLLDIADHIMKDLP